MSSRVRFVLLACIVAALAFGASACTKPEPAAPKPAVSAPTELSGSITIAGSTSVQPVSELLAEAFKSKHPKTTIYVQGGGSSAGVKAADTGTAQIGASSRDLKPDEKHLTQFVIGIDGIAVIVHPSNAIADLSLEQVRDIYIGKITNWRDVGGPDSPIVAVTREEGSGTRGAFEEVVMKGEPISSGAIVQNSTGAVATTVSGDKNAIGYVSLAALTSSVKAIKVDGVEPTVENIVSKSYKVARPFLYLTKGEPQALAKQFIDFVMSADGQAIVQKAGLVSTR